MRHPAAPDKQLKPFEVLHAAKRRQISIPSQEAFISPHPISTACVMALRAPAYVSERTFPGLGFSIRHGNDQPPTLAALLICIHCLVRFLKQAPGVVSYFKRCHTYADSEVV